MATTEQRLRMGEFIRDYEARRDAEGKLTVYKLPSGDGGGEYEVAGINQRFHPQAAARLKAMVEAGQQAEAEQFIVNYLVEYTSSVVTYHNDVGVEFFLRDTAFNRGPTGSLMILQIAVKAGVDGIWGTETETKTKALSVPDLLKRLRAAREVYERRHRDESSKFWAGLVHRWDKVYVQAQKFSAGNPLPAPASKVAPASRPAPLPAPVPTAPIIKPALTPLSRLPGPLGALLGLIRWRRLPCLMPRATTLAPPLDKRTSDVPTSPQGPSGPPTVPTWHTRALENLGFHETGVNQGIEKFIDGAKSGSRAVLLGQPYCAVGVNYCLETVGLPGSRSAMARSYEKHKDFVRLPGPALGAIGTLWRGSPNAGTGHVFFYAGHDDKGRVIGLGFNQGDSVSFAPQDMKRLTGWWWPKSVPLPPIGPVRFEGGAQSASET